MVTLADIAREVDVDVSTVSKVLHRKGVGFNVLTRKRVTAAARRLGYRPSSLARSLVRGKTECIGVVGHDLATPMTMEKVDLLARLANEQGYQTLLGGRNTEGNPAAEKQQIEEMIARHMDGLIIFILPECDMRYYRKLSERKIPFVLIGQHSRERALPLVSVNTEQGMYDVTRHLLDLGHRDIAMAWGRFAASVPHSRAAGVERALREEGVTLCVERIFADRLDTNENVYNFTREQLARTPRPTAILYGNDDRALAGLWAIHEMGLEVPRDVSVAGYDDLPSAAFTSPPLTTSRQPRQELAEAAMRLLIEQIEGAGSVSGKHVILTPKLVIRQSTGPAPRNVLVNNRREAT